MPLPRFAEQLFRRLAVPGVRQVGSRRQSHVDLGIATSAAHSSSM
jgi:hypothetical protein